MTSPAEARRLRIALVIEDVNLRGGQERVIGELAPRLARRHEVHLFCQTVGDISLEGIEVHRVRDVRAPLGLRALWFALASSRAIRARDYDVILSQGGNTLVQSATLVHTCHPERRRVRLEIERPWRLKGPLRRLWEAVRDGIFARMERRAVLRCRGAVIAVSEDLKGYLLREYGLAPEEVHVAPNGVDHTLFHPGVAAEHRARIREQLGLGDDEFVALFMGGRWFEKGLPEIIQGLGMTERDVRLVVVGSGDAGRLGEMAREAGVGDHVTFVPHVPEPEAYYGMTDCLIHAPVVEPFGLVMLEAAACGLPLLATRAGVALDLIEDGLTGFAITREPGDIADRLDLLAANPELRATMSAHIHRRALGFSWERQAEQIERVLLAVAGEGAAT